MSQLLDSFEDDLLFVEHILSAVNNLKKVDITMGSEIRYHCGVSCGLAECLTICVVTTSKKYIRRVRCYCQPLPWLYSLEHEKTVPCLFQ